MSPAIARKLRRFTVDDYERMIAAGVFVERGRVELLAGEIVEMAAMGLVHADSVANLNRQIGPKVPSGFRLGVQLPILLDDASEPEPDLMVYRRRRGFRPTPTDILLVIEVADSSLDYDRNRKFPRYAAAGIPEAWLFDVAVSVLERHTEPFEGRYRRLETVRRGAVLASTTLPDLALSVDAILAPEDGD